MSQTSSSTKKRSASTGSTGEAKNGGWVKVSYAVLRDPTLSDRAVRLYAEICTFAYESTGSACWAAQTTMADDLGWSVRKVQETADELLERGLITRQRTGRTNEYRPVRSAEIRGSDTRKSADQIRENPRTKQKQEVEVSKQTATRAKDPAPEQAPEPAAPQPDVAVASRTSNDEVEALLTDYDNVVIASGRKAPPRGGRDQLLALTLLDRLDAKTTLERLTWALKDEFWMDKVGEGFHRFAGKAVDSIGKQMEQPFDPRVDPPPANFSMGIELAR
jgi:Helix-turn-helix domain